MRLRHEFMKSWWRYNIMTLTTTKRQSRRRALDALKTRFATWRLRIGSDSLFTKREIKLTNISSLAAGSA